MDRALPGLLAPARRAPEGTRERDGAMSEAPEGSVVVECDVEAEPQTVWRALTEPDLREAWLGPEAASITEVSEDEPGRRLSWTWRAEGDDRTSRVSVEVTPADDGGSRFRLVHVASAVVVAFPRRQQP